MLSIELKHLIRIKAKNKFLKFLIVKSKKFYLLFERRKKNESLFSRVKSVFFTRKKGRKNNGIFFFIRTQLIGEEVSEAVMVYSRSSSGCLKIQVMSSD